MIGKPEVNEQRRPRTPWARLAAIALLGVVWAGSLFYSLTWSIALTPYGRIGDGAIGYDEARAVGLAYGSLVVQTRRRTWDVGWQFHREEFLFRLQPFVHGGWPVRTYALPLPCVMVTIAVTIVPGWIRLRRERKPKGKAKTCLVRE